MNPVRIAVIGMEKIARDQHLPAIAGGIHVLLEKPTGTTHVLPANRAAPIAFQDTAGAPIGMDLDWRQTGSQSRDIVVETDAGTLKLSQGGAVLSLPDGDAHNEDREYPGLYGHFATLIRSGRNDVDTDPLRLVSDAFLRGRREISDAFEE